MKISKHGIYFPGCCSNPSSIAVSRTDEDGLIVQAGFHVFVLMMRHLLQTFSFHSDTSANEKKIFDVYATSTVVASIVYLSHLKLQMRNDTVNRLQASRQY